MDPRPPDLQSPTIQLTGRARYAPALMISIIALIVRWPFIAAPGFVGDQVQFVKWAEVASTAGMAELYRPRPDGSGKLWCNYPPAYLFVLRGLGSAFDWIGGQPLRASVVLDMATGRPTPGAALAAWLFKMPAVLADVLLAALLTTWLIRRAGLRAGYLVALAYALLPAVIHDSAVWGQVDAIPALLMVATLEAGVRRRFGWMGLLFALAMLTKAQSVMILPIVGMIALFSGGAAVEGPALVPGDSGSSALGPGAAGQSQAGAKSFSVTGLVRCFAGAVVPVVLVVVPFWPARAGLWDAYAGAARYYPFTHLNGFSMWFLGHPLVSPQLGQVGVSYVRDDVPGILSLAPRTAGFTLLAIMTAVVIWGLWIRRCDTPSIYWATRVMPLAFFFFSTQMHERYLVPALALWAWAFVRTRRWVACWAILATVCSINVLWAWPGPGDGSVVNLLRSALQTTWLGLAPGLWCAIGLAGVLIVSIVGVGDPARQHPKFEAR